ncbi:MAG: peptide deformylase [Arsenophonus sp.]|nr:MAG: peptide deformylase [Arsenophonus sp.]
MSILNILMYPDNNLRLKAKIVKRIDSTIKKNVHDMLDTMYEKEGIGLAATQVNINLRIIVVDISATRTEGIVIINPMILKKNGKTGIQEGCLSIPGEQIFVPRSKNIKIVGLNIKGEKVEISTDGLLSICFQHEVDHLNGILFIDYLSKFYKNQIYKKMLRLKKLKEKNIF